VVAPVDGRLSARIGHQGPVMDGRAAALPSAGTYEPVHVPRSHEVHRRRPVRVPCRFGEKVGGFAG
jgi:hypothetical protein